MNVARFPIRIGIKIKVKGDGHEFRPTPKIRCRQNRRFPWQAQGRLLVGSRSLRERLRFLMMTKAESTRLNVVLFPIKGKVKGGG